jgi:hypothetical protein
MLGILAIHPTNGLQRYANDVQAKADGAKVIPMTTIDSLPKMDQNNPEAKTPTNAYQSKRKHMMHNVEQCKHAVLWALSNINLSVITKPADKNIMSNLHSIAGTGEFAHTAKIKILMELSKLSRRVKLAQDDAKITEREYNIHDASIFKKFSDQGKAKKTYDLTMWENDYAGDSDLKEWLSSLKECWNLYKRQRNANHFVRDTENQRFVKNELLFKKQIEALDKDDNTVLHHLKRMNRIIIDTEWYVFSKKKQELWEPIYKRSETDLTKDLPDDYKKILDLLQKTLQTAKSTKKNLKQIAKAKKQNSRNNQENKPLVVIENGNQNKSSNAKHAASGDDDGKSMKSGSTRATGTTRASGASTLTQKSSSSRGMSIKVKPFQPSKFGGIEPV